MRRETDMLAKVKAGGLSLPPAELRVLDVEPTAGLAAAADAIVEACWEGQIVRFLAEVSKLATPKALRQAIALARDVASPLPHGGRAVPLAREA